MRPSRHHCRRVPIYPPGPGSHRGKSGMGGGALAQAASMAAADSCSGSNRPFGPYNASGGGGCSSRCAATPAPAADAAGVTAGAVTRDAAAASGAMGFVAGGGANGERPRPAGGAPVWDPLPLGGSSPTMPVRARWAGRRREGCQGQGEKGKREKERRNEGGRKAGKRGGCRAA